MRREIRRALAAAGGSLLGLAAFPADGTAATLTFGSTLSAPANRIEARQADTVYFNADLPGATRTRVPADGQITGIRVKGIAPRHADLRPPGSPPPAPFAGSPLFHVQVLARRRDGTHRVKTTSSDFLLPTEGDPQQVSSFTSGYRLCVRRGDVVAFNSIGGWDGIVDQTGPYPAGTPLQIFATGVGGAVLRTYTANEGTKDGATIRSRPVARQELLMQLRLGTGRDANQVCPGGSAGAPPPKPPKPTYATVPARKVGIDRRHRGRIGVYCHTGADRRKRCRGRLNLSAPDPATGQPVVLGAAGFSLAPGRTSAVTFRLTRAGRSLYRAARRRLTATATAVTRPGGAFYTRTATVTVRPWGAD